MSSPNFTYILQNNCSNTPENNSIRTNHNNFFKKERVNHINGKTRENNNINNKQLPDAENLLTRIHNNHLPMKSANKKMLIKEKHDHDGLYTKTSDPTDIGEMPRLTKEVHSEIKMNRTKPSNILNQRYQNVLRFPNYRQRKKCAFEKKLKRCGVELNGETTISNLRKILQPYIYKEINNILDKYIEAYFMKAFNNIRENINLTSENWSHTLKSSISKSLYKQYCEIANVDPFNPLSIANDDFPYFQISQKINQKDSGMTADNSAKFEIDNSTGHESDTNSHCSQFSTTAEKLEIDQEISIAEISLSSEQISEYPYNHYNDDVDTIRPMKRHIQVVNELSTDMPDNPLKLNDSTCSNRKYQKIVHSTQSYSSSPYLSHYDNNSGSFILQKIQEPETSSTARFENRNQSFLLVRKTKEQSSSAIESEIYLNTQNPIATNNIVDHLYAHNYPC